MNENYGIDYPDLKLVWTIEIDILERLKLLCKKHHLKYYAGGGTMLGAIRHKGFIPWDDDIDIYMMWEDYKVLLDVAPKELGYPYFFQSYLTEPYAEVSGSRIRRSDTTGCTKWEYENIIDPNYNKGIFIDIFPVFNIPMDKNIKKTQFELINKYWRAIRGFNALAFVNEASDRQSKYAQYISDYQTMSKELSIKRIRDNYLRCCSMIDTETEEVGLTSFRTHQENLIWKKEWFARSIEVPFENTTINCPEQSEKILEKTYGNWRIPVKGAVHEFMFLDPQTPYSDFLIKINDFWGR